MFPVCVYLFTKKLWRYFFIKFAYRFHSCEEKLESDSDTCYSSTLFLSTERDCLAFLQSIISVGGASLPHHHCWPADRHMLCYLSSLSLSTPPWSCYWLRDVQPVAASARPPSTFYPLECHRRQQTMAFFLLSVPTKFPPLLLSLDSGLECYCFTPAAGPQFIIINIGNTTIYSQSYFTCSFYLRSAPGDKSLA